MKAGLRETFRRFLNWLREGAELPADGGVRFGRGEPPAAGDDSVECPWRYRWE